MQPSCSRCDVSHSARDCPYRDLVPHPQGCYAPGCGERAEVELRRVFTETRLSGTRYGYCKECAHHAIYEGGWTWA